MEKHTSREAFILLCEWARCGRGQGRVTEVALTDVTADSGRRQEVQSLTQPQGAEKVILTPKPCLEIIWILVGRRGASRQSRTRAVYAS